MVAKQDGYRRRAEVADIVGPVQDIRLLHGLGTITRETGHAQALGQHLLVGGHPGQAGAADDADHLLGHRALGWPHALRIGAEQLTVQLDAALHLGHRVARVAETVREVDLG